MSYYIFRELVFMGVLGNVALVMIFISGVQRIIFKKRRKTTPEVVTLTEIDEIVRAMTADGWSELFVNEAADVASYDPGALYIMRLWFKETDKDRRLTLIHDLEDCVEEHSGEQNYGRRY